MFSIVAAYDLERGIAADGKLPWPKNKADMRHFVDLTTTTLDVTKQNVVLMGRKTWESIGSKPLPNRINVVISRGVPGEKTALWYDDFNVALYALSSINKERIFVIGGEEIYKIAITDPRCEALFITIINQTYRSDKFFPPIPEWFECVGTLEGGNDCQFLQYNTRLDVNSSEYEYLNLLYNVLYHGDSISEERTGVGTLSLDGGFMKFPICTLNPEAPMIDLEYSVPIMTTKTLFTRGAFEELIMFLNGDTSVKDLQKKGVKIWDDNTSRSWLDSHNLPYETGETGPFYGFQWNFFGADYLGPNSRDAHAKDPRGVNQLEQCINLLKTDPYSRRIVLTAWNPIDLPRMCLPPCHMTYVFKVRPPQPGSCGKKVLCCTMLQRSGDMFLGIPFNIFSTTLLTIFMSRAAGMLPGFVNIVISDAHIYKNHIDQVKEQLSRVPYRFPTLKINAKIDSLQDMRNLKYSNLEIKNYHKWPAIKGEFFDSA